MFDTIESSMDMNSYAEASRFLYQEEVNSGYEFANNYFAPKTKGSVQEELERGSLIFSDMGVRVDNIVYSGTGARLGTDYKKLIFKDDTVFNELGKRYKLRRNIWITTNLGEYETATYSAVIRRCNSTLNFEISNENKKIIYREPCIIDYPSEREGLEERGNLILANRRVTVIVQKNKYTEDITINNRFILGKQAFKVTAIEDYMNMNTTADNPGLITLTMEKDDLSPEDDLENRVAYGTNKVDEKEIPEGVLKGKKRKKTETPAVPTPPPAPAPLPPVQQETEPEPDILEEEEETREFFEKGNFKIYPSLFVIKEGTSIDYKVVYKNKNETENITINTLDNVPAANYSVLIKNGFLNVENKKKYFGELLTIRIYKNEEYVDLLITLKGKF